VFWWKSKKDREHTVEAVQAHHIILRDQLAPCQSRIQVHYSFRVQGMHESQDVADFVSRHMDEIRQPNSCNTRIPFKNDFLFQSPCTPTNRPASNRYPTNMPRTRAFLPAKAHVSQNPVFVVVKVDLASWREERVSQFSRDAVETMVQVGLQTIGVVGGVEACQDRERGGETYLRAEEGNPHSIMSAPCRQQPEGGGG